MAFNDPNAKCQTCGRRVERSVLSNKWVHYWVTDLDCPDGLPVDHLLERIEIG